MRGSAQLDEGDLAIGAQAHHGSPCTGSSRHVQACIAVLVQSLDPWIHAANQQIERHDLPVVRVPRKHEIHPCLGGVLEAIGTVVEKNTESMEVDVQRCEAVSHGVSRLGIVDADELNVVSRLGAIPEELHAHSF